MKNYMGSMEELKFCVKVSLSEVCVAKATESCCDVRSGASWEITHGLLSDV